MLRVIGRRVVDVPPAEYGALCEPYRGVLLDIGTGDGKHVLHLARRRPEWLVIGVDAAADRMRKASTRAAANPARGGLRNAMFVVAAAERLPAELTGAAEIHVLMPWGSLLRGMIGGDQQMLARIAAAGRPGADFLVTLNLHAWQPRVSEVGDVPEPDPEWAMSQLALGYRQAGWFMERAAYLDDTEIAELATSWTKRLGASRSQLDVLSLTGTLRADAAAGGSAVDLADGTPVMAPAHQIDG